MRTTLAYTSARILLLVVAMILLYLAGARGILLVALALVVSGIASFVLLSRQRDVMSGALTARLRNRRARTTSFRGPGWTKARASEDDDRGPRPRVPRKMGARQLIFFFFFFPPPPPPPPASQPPPVSSRSTVATASCAVSSEVSITRSASSGSSYGSETPVNC